MAGSAAVLPYKRTNCIYELVIHGENGRFKMYLTVGLSPDGRPLEIWMDCAKDGTTLRELMHSWAALFSIALQSGVPLPRLVKLYRDWRFQPCGRVEGFDKVQKCESMVSLVALVLDAEFGGNP